MVAMLIGYCRCSTDNQELTTQCEQDSSSALGASVTEGALQDFAICVQAVT